MINDTNKMTITDDNGNDVEVEIILTFEDDKGNHYVLFADPEDDEMIHACKFFMDSGELEAVTDEDEFAMCEEVLGAFQKESDDE